MGLKTIPFRDIEDKAENMYEAVSAMSGQAKVELQERILSRVIMDHREEEMDVFDEIEEISPESYEEKEKVTTLDTKDDPVAGDSIGIVDSEDSNAMKKTTLTQLQTLVDTDTQLETESANPGLSIASKKIKLDLTTLDTCDEKASGAAEDILCVEV